MTTNEIEAQPYTDDECVCRHPVAAHTINGTCKVPGCECVELDDSGEES